jgi:pseudomonalisin
MILALRLRPNGQADRDRLLAGLQDPRSPSYHHWLTPEEFGARFGLSDEALGRVTTWLRDQGFTIDAVGRGRGWIDFSGTVGQVERAFETDIHDYRVDSALRHANATEPSIPRGLEDSVAGVVSLHDFPIPPLLHISQTSYTSSGGTHAIAPADFAIIYDLRAAYEAGITGAGESIAVVARSDVQLSDIHAFRSVSGLPANDPVVLHNGPDPGVAVADEGEADLDTEWSGAVAFNATIQLVASQSTGATDGVALSAQYIVDQNLAPVINTSFGECEAQLGATARSFWADLWAQAAAQGITSVVSSGDSGAAGCNARRAPLGTTHAVNGLCSTADNLCVGGTQFNDVANPSTYWSATSDPVTGASALSYIPEIAWNESGTVPGGSDLSASAGGPSAFVAKPTWQNGPGVPNDGSRDVPDLSLSAAEHDGYRFSWAGSLVTTGGTSASAPAIAGLMALVVQSTGSRQGNANPTLYAMALAQDNGTGPAVIHDVTSGNTNVPGVTGFNAGPGYDQATGLGSVDGGALIAHWTGSGGFSACSPSMSTLCIDDQQGDRRFEVTVSYQTSQGGGLAGQGTAIPLSSLGIGQGGLFWFFNATNPEMLIKVLNGCSVNGHFWVFSAANSNVGWTTTVRDTRTGAAKTYSNTDLTAAPPVQDTAALPCAPAAATTVP